MSEAPLLTQPFTLRGLTLKNRTVVSPMCTYSAVDGMVDDFHLGRFALGGAGPTRPASMSWTARAAAWAARKER